MIAIRILIHAEDPLARLGLAALLAGAPSLTVVGQSDPADGFPDALAAYQPDVIVWDAGWEPSLLAIPPAAEAATAPPLLALVPDAAAARQAWRAGARGLLPRDAPLPRLEAAIAALSHGDAVLDPGLIPAALSPPFQEMPELAEELTSREREVLGLLAQGLPNKTIADRLSVTEHTVKFHVNAILGKLGAASRTDAVVRASRMGLIAI